MTSFTLRNTRPISTFALSTLMAMSSLSAFAEGSLNLSTGYDYTTGSYGQNVNTDIVYVPVTLNYLKDAWSYKVTVPYISVTGNGAVIPGTGGMVSSGGFFGGGGSGGMGGGMTSTSQTVTNSGLGDVTASVGYGFFPEAAFYEISAKIKFATADENKGLGTGENDYYLQFDGMVGDGSAIPFFTLGYAILGDSADFTFKDVPYATVGLMLKTGKSTSLGVSYDYRQATITGTDDLSQASAFVSWKMSDQWSTSLSATTGFTDSSPDSGFGLSISKHY